MVRWRSEREVNLNFKCESIEKKGIYRKQLIKWDPVCALILVQISLFIPHNLSFNIRMKFIRLLSSSTHLERDILQSMVLAPVIALSLSLLDRSYPQA